MGVRRCSDCMDELHVANIIKVNEILEHHDEPLSVQAYSEDRRREGQLTDGGVALYNHVSIARSCY